MRYWHQHLTGCEHLVCRMSLLSSLHAHPPCQIILDVIGSQLVVCSRGCNRARCMLFPSSPISDHLPGVEQGKGKPHYSCRESSGSKHYFAVDGRVNLDSSCNERVIEINYAKRTVKFWHTEIIILYNNVTARWWMMFAKEKYKIALLCTRVTNKIVVLVGLIVNKLAS